MTNSSLPYVSSHCNTDVPYSAEWGTSVWWAIHEVGFRDRGLA
jgi:hypothetical protein